MIPYGTMKALYPELYSQVSVYFGQDFIEDYGGGEGASRPLWPAIQATKPRCWLSSTPCWRNPIRKAN